jgi:flagellar biosynthetic protein FliQ
MLIIAAPVLLVALVVGMLVSFMQAVTQMNEATLSFLPKLIAVGITLVIVGPWMISMLTDYLRRVISGIPGVIHGG